MPLQPYEGKPNQDEKPVIKSSFLIGPLSLKEQEKEHMKGWHILDVTESIYEYEIIGLSTIVEILGICIFDTLMHYVHAT